MNHAQKREDEEALRAIAGGLDEIFNGSKRPKPVGFVLLVFPHDGELGARTNYVSNSNRADIIVAMKEVIARFEGQAEVTGRA